MTDAAAKSLQSCPTLCDPIDGSHQAPPSVGFSRQEHWSGLPFPSPMQESEKWKWSHSVVSRLFVIPWTSAYQAPPSMGFSRQEYWSGVPLLSPGMTDRYLQINIYQTELPHPKSSPTIYSISVNGSSLLPADEAKNLGIFLWLHIQFFNKACSSVVKYISRTQSLPVISPSTSLV